jgi:cytochrome b involved in lipid metabolism
MQKTKIILGVVILLIFIAGGIFIINKSPTDTYTNTKDTQTPTKYLPTSTTPTKPNTPVVNTPTVKSYTIAEVGAHNTEKDCYTIVNGNVYDVTAWIHSHPGGAKNIISMCGKDASSSFDNQHGGEKRPESELANFLIGKLK